MNFEKLKSFSCNEWIHVNDKLPPDGLFVELCCFGKIKGEGEKIKFNDYGTFWSSSGWLRQFSQDEKADIIYWKFPTPLPEVMVE